MGRRGPRPVPKATKARLGMRDQTKSQAKYHGKKKKVIQSDFAPLKDIAPPEFLSPLAKAEWKRVAPMLKKAKLLTVGDVSALAGYCQAWAEFRQCTKVIRKTGLVFESVSGHGTTYKPRPEVAIRQKAALAILRFCVEFGMTPSSRARMEVSDEPPKKKMPDAFEEMLSND